MDRRQYLAGVSSLAAGGAGLLGSTAFTQVDANREVEVAVAADDEAFLALNAVDREIARQNSRGIIDLVINRDHPKNARGEGVNSKSVYEIVGIVADRIFDIENYGDRSVSVWVETVTTAGPQIEIFDVHDSSRSAIDSENPVTLPPGNRIETGLRIITSEGTTPGNYAKELMIQASNSEPEE